MNRVCIIENCSFHFFFDYHNNCSDFRNTPPKRLTTNVISHVSVILAFQTTFSPRRMLAPPAAAAEAAAVKSKNLLYPNPKNDRNRRRTTPPLRYSTTAPLVSSTTLSVLCKLDQQLNYRIEPIHKRERAWGGLSK